MKERTTMEEPETQPAQVGSESSQTEGYKPLSKKKNRRGWLIALAVLASLIVILFALYQIPAIHDRAYYYVNTVRSKVFYFLKPPAESNFEISSETTMNSDVIATLTALAPTATLMPTTEPTHALTATLVASPTPTPEPTAIPSAVQLEGVVQEYQRLNSCGPTNMALILRYWGWEGDEIDIEKVVKPRLEDLNVTPQEMLDYMQKHTEQDAVLRLGGTVDLLKRLIAAGYPVLVERGYVNRDDEWNGWMGHYGVVDGYDDAQQAVHIPDTVNGNIWVKYDILQQGWDEFSGTYLVVFPPQEREIVLDLLGADADPEYNLNTTLEKFRQRSETAELSEQYFAYYSLGELLVMKKDYLAAAEAFDTAFSVYNWLPVDHRPWRMLWYQVGPYEAYYYTGRYKAVISLTYKTITDASKPALPETFLWSGRANVALGNTNAAIWDFKRALEWHPGWEPAVAELKALGIDPEQ
ncbi:MAG: C39 family peptidase [Anaerolineaceae bacterium]|jgi:tetratricopeptide (TPR) repeat protein|nr:C39 family peptidase [Anaerolineaceae bacterium]